MPKKKKPSEWPKDNEMGANDGSSDELDESYKKEDGEDDLGLLEENAGDDDKEEDNY